VSIHAELKKLNGYVSSQTVKSTDDLRHIVLAASADVDLSEDIYRRVVANRWSLALLVKEKLSLEDVFKKLTQ
jgi:hypothetical protein